ncbi:hypothetical protein STAFG_6895 [Streptomyces afghaniensis 772]|uniref:Uncharacterized protein n=1 Tax=Streptomyces afghaniensis 772 TaxID=1283301 RepID=S4NCU4_9ACTN|nr:hypothetical protein STAFG_6895 [Streptomyces afghaniensis 772]
MRLTAPPPGTEARMPSRRCDLRAASGAPAKSPPLEAHGGVSAASQSHA